jgi:hypothetical protein
MCSAVDHHTAEHMFNNCIKGLFATKAVILVTHQLQFIRRCDKVAIVDHGKFQYFGPFTAQAQSILSKFLPVPDEDTANDIAKEKKKVVVAPKKAAAIQVEEKPVTKLKMGAAAWRLINAGPAWKLFLALGFGLCSQSSRQMSDFWIRYWCAPRSTRLVSDQRHPPCTYSSDVDARASLCAGCPVPA